MVDYDNLDLNQMTIEEIVEIEKQYLVEELGKKLIDSDERDDREGGYRFLALKYWPEEFEDGTLKHVHHINFNRSDNRVSNLVVVTPKEHSNIHWLFDIERKPQNNRTLKHFCKTEKEFTIISKEKTHICKN